MALADTLKLARELRDKGGFSQEAAGATAEALNDALGGEVAADTRAELLKWMFGQTFVILAVVAALHFAK